MEKITKRIEAALTQMQLAENEMNRMKIQKKPVTLDDKDAAMLVGIQKITDALKLDVVL